MNLTSIIFMVSIFIFSNQLLAEQTNITEKDKATTGNRLKSNETQITVLFGKQQTLKNRLYVESSYAHYIGEGINIYFISEGHFLKLKNWYSISITDFNYGKYEPPGTNNFTFNNLTISSDSSFYRLKEDLNSEIFSKVGFGGHIKYDYTQLSEKSSLNQELFFFDTFNIQFGPSIVLDANKHKNLQVQAVLGYGYNMNILYSDSNINLDSFEEPWEGANQWGPSGLLNITYNETFTTAIHYRSTGFTDSISLLFGIVF